MGLLCLLLLANIVMLILNDVFNLPSYCHDVCFPFIFANTGLGCNAAFSPVERLFCPNVLTLQRLEELSHAKQFLWDGSSNSILKWFCLYYFTHRKRQETKCKKKIRSIILFCSYCYHFDVFPPPLFLFFFN